MKLTRIACPRRELAGVWCRLTFVALASLALDTRGASAQTGSSPASAPAAKSDSTPHIHLRVLGVFDADTGDPLEGADVSDAATGIVSRTTKTGTVALILRDTSGTLVGSKKVGYQPITQTVSTGLTDTVPVTVLMLKSGFALAPIITVGNRAVRLAPTDTVKQLLKNGFYERRETGGAPSSAFITGEKLKNATLLSDARFFGRAICESNLYVDGVRVSIPRRGGKFRKEGIDALFNSFDVAGIETYHTGDLPSDVAHTADGGLAFGAGAASIGCVTLIWLKN